MKSHRSFWVPQNTHWSGGTTWFDTGGHRDRSASFNTKEEAEQANKKWASLMKCPNAKFRVLHIEITETIYEDNKNSS